VIETHPRGIKILDIAYPRLRVPDLDAMEEFLVEFGLVKVARTTNTLYMRGTGPPHHIHVTEKGDPGFVSLAYYARNEEDLHRVAHLPEATSRVHALDEPGGGKRVLLKEPNNGFNIEIVHGIELLPELPIRYQSPNWNTEVMRTIGNPARLRFGPAHVKRISHGVLATPHLKQTLAWFRDTLGLLCTDEFYIDSRDNLVGGFYRLDRGAEPVDHHVLNCYKNERAGFQHASFVVQDVEDLLIGHSHLTRIGKYKHVRGVGYHPPGGQIYDYWLNPSQQMHEIYLPTQRFTSDDPSNLMPFPGAAAINRTSAFADNITELAPFDIGD
jgi:catechol 2,3-dioxygenase-like lactoylglutathione lyase family enzyme